jgi:predicted NBD/HSP70 family sugar kinase
MTLDRLLGRRMNAPDMRSVNAIRLLTLVREHGPVSRAALARLSELSKPTVSEQIGRLVEFGAVIEIGKGDAAGSGGKRPTMVAFHANAGRVAGIAIGLDGTTVALADLRGRITVRNDIRDGGTRQPGRLLARIESAIEVLMRSDAGRPIALRAIGVGVPGRVDCTAGTVLEAGNLDGWTDVDVRGQLQRAFDCPVLVDNDVNVALLAELRQGAARSAATAVIVRVGKGIGSAVAMNGRIHHGSHWAAGEIAHLTSATPLGRTLSPRGQLESVLGADQIRKRVRAAARRSILLRRLLRSQSEIESLFTAAKQHDEVAKPIAADIVRHLSMAVAHQALAYDPDVILLSGDVFRYASADVRKTLRRTIPWPLVIEQASFAEEGVLLGAIEAAASSAYEDLSRRLEAEGAMARTAVNGG